MLNHVSMRAVIGALAVPAVLVALALATVCAWELATRLQVCVIDVLDAHNTAVGTGQGPIAETLFVAVERSRAASHAARHLAGGLAAVSLVGGVAFVLFGTESRLIRTVSLVVVMLLLVRACYWIV